MKSVAIADGGFIHQPRAQIKLSLSFFLLPTLFITNPALEKKEKFEIQSMISGETKSWYIHMGLFQPH